VPLGSNLLSNHTRTYASFTTSEILARGRPEQATQPPARIAAAAAQLLGEDRRGYELARRLEMCGAWQIMFAAADGTVPGRLASRYPPGPASPSAPWSDPSSSMVSSLTY
jgi:hypothetical protein